MVKNMNDMTDEMVDFKSDINLAKFITGQLSVAYIRSLCCIREISSEVVLQAVAGFVTDVLKANFETWHEDGEEKLCKLIHANWADAKYVKLK